MSSEIMNALKGSIPGAIIFIVASLAYGMALNICVMNIVETLGLAPSFVKKLPLKRKMKCGLYFSIIVFIFALVVRQFSQ